uniref:hypothetical protein n=1 Tax=Vaginimicrobium propionicum TaxID=1871034 RepID=UPI0012EC2DF9|nr:hypothetical protein [Vaginimicrobium propionicum]
MDEQPIVPVPSDPKPTPPAQPDGETVVMVKSREAHLDLSAPILEVLTNPNLPDL